MAQGFVHRPRSIAVARMDDELVLEIALSGASGGLGMRILAESRRRRFVVSEGLGDQAAFVIARPVAAALASG